MIMYTALRRAVGVSSFNGHLGTNKYSLTVEDAFQMSCQVSIVTRRTSPCRLPSHLGALRVAVPVSEQGLKRWHLELEAVVAVY